MHWSLKMQCHDFVFFLVFMCLWGWQFVIITPGMFFMSNNDLPCILGFLLGAGTFNFQSANPNPALSWRNSNATCPSLSYYELCGRSWPCDLSVSFVVVQRAVAAVKQLSYIDEIWLNFIYRQSDRVIPSVLSLTCVFPISMTTNLPT